MREYIDSENEGIRVTLLGFAGNIPLIAIKLAGAILDKSTALAADTIHSISDLLTDGITLCTHKISQVPKDSEHS